MIECNIQNRDEWQCPEGTGVPLITMPNVPKPLHGMPPRVIMGNTKWNMMRKRCYFDANYKCEICGCEPEKGNLHAHELYSYDYKEGTGTFERCIAVCKTCHDGIHSGRLITMFKNGNPLYPKSYVLKVVENAFKLVFNYNEMNKNKRPLRLFATFVDYLDVPELREDMEKLIKKYHIMFYDSPKRCAKWGDWKLLWNGREYQSPYANQTEWAEAMAKQAENDSMRKVSNPFSGGIYDELNELLK